VSVLLGANRRGRVAGLGGTVTELGRPVPHIRGRDQFRQSLGAALQLRAQLLVGILALGRCVMTGVAVAVANGGFSTSERAGGPRRPVGDAYGSRPGLAGLVGSEDCY